MQSRPVTSLYPLPDEHRSSRAIWRVLASFGAFQGVLDPLTPLGIDALRTLAATAAQLLKYDVTWETQGALKVAGQRLFLDLTALLRNGFGRRLLHGALGQVEPATGEAILQIWDDSRLAVTRERPSPRVLRRIAPLILPLAGRFLLALARPEAAQREAEQSVGMAIAYYEGLAAETHTLSQRLDLLNKIAGTIRKFLLVHLFPRFVPGMIALNRLYRLSDEVPEGRQLALEVLRALPHNVTTEMDLALWDTARHIRQNPAALAGFTEQDSRELAQAYHQGLLPPVAQQALQIFLHRYGMRGLVEIDLGRPRWRDDPSPVMEAVQSYLKITDPQRAPDAIFARGAVSAQGAIATLSSELRKTRGGRRKAARARWAARRVRALAGLRESPKFTIVSLLGIAREALLESGAELAEAGLLTAKDDVFFLSLAELHALALAQERGDDLTTWGAQAASR